MKSYMGADSMGRSNIHSDHRKRMRKRFAQNTLRDFADHEALEMLLYSAIPRRNTNDIAHDLIGKFGKIHEVLTEDKDALCTVDGIGNATAEQIVFFGELFDRLNAGVFANMPIDSMDKAGMYAMLRMSLSPADSASVMYLDGDGRIISEERLYRGKGNMTDDLPINVVRLGIELGAASILLMHNHRHEPLEPSPDDKHITYMLRREAEKAGIKNVMHVIVSDDGYIHI